MELLRLYWRRLRCWFEFVGREGYFPGWRDRIGPMTAWRVACSIYSMEDLKKWWLGTGWMGPGAPDWYAGWPDIQVKIFMRSEIARGVIEDESGF